MSGYVLKPVHGCASFLIDWRRGYLEPGETVRRDLGWAIRPASDIAGLRVTMQLHDEARSWAEFAGGEPGRFYMVSNRVLTSDDRVLSRAIVMRIAQGEGPQ